MPSLGTVRRKHEVNGQTCFRWRNRHGGLAASKAKRSGDPECEDTEMKAIVPEVALPNQVLRASGARIARLSSATSLRCARAYVPGNERD